MIIFDKEAYEEVLELLEYDDAEAKLCKNIIRTYIAVYNDKVIHEMSEYPDLLSRL